MPRLTDAEVEDWAAYGRRIQLTDSPLSSDMGRDTFTLWGVVAALHEQVAELRRKGEGQ